jgi:competence protein ComEC
MTYSKVFLYFCVSFIVGIFIDSFFKFNIPALLVVLILAILLVFVFWRYKMFVVIGFCLVFALIGVFRHHQVDILAVNSPLTLMAEQQQEVVLQGSVCAEPDVRDTITKLTICNIELNNNSQNFLNGKVLINVERYPEYKYGDRVEATGKLELPTLFEDSKNPFNYMRYLAKDGIYATMRYSKHKLSDEPDTSSNIFGTLHKNCFSAILTFKGKLRQVIYQNLSPPHSLMLGSIILGDKKRISDEMKEKLNITGTRHITCISGMHIIILSGMLMRLWLAIGLWRNQAFYLTIIPLIFFIIMVGAPASAVRAGIMAGMILFAQKIDRLRSADRAIVFAAVLILFFNPLLLRSDIGFQLSFLASIGIIYLNPIVQDFYEQNKLKKYFELSLGSLKSFWDIVFMSLSAQIFTLPVLIYNFGYVSLVVIFTNILIIPVLPFIFGIGFLFILLGVFSNLLAWLLSLPCWLLLSYIIVVIEKFSNVPFVFCNLNMHWIIIPVFYVILGIIVRHFYKKFKEPFFLK